MLNIYKLGMYQTGMVKMGRPTDNPRKQYSVHLPISISKNLTPKGNESQSRRIEFLVTLGIEYEKILKKRKVGTGVLK